MSDLCRVCDRRETHAGDGSGSMPLFRRTIIFRVLAPQLEKGQALAVIGSHPSLGSWNPMMFLKMYPSGEDEWTFSLNVDNVREVIEYKYVVIDESENKIIKWEEGVNRHADSTQLRDGQVLVLSGENLRVRERTWKRRRCSRPAVLLAYREVVWRRRFRRFAPFRRLCRGYRHARNPTSAFV